MKRVLALFLCILTAVSACGCGKKEAAKKASDTKGDTKTAEMVKNGEYDFDYSRMSTSVAYSQLIEFMNNAPSYVGKTMKLKGTYVKQYSEDMKKDYYYIIINDTTACCSAYAEILAEGCEYPAESSDDKNEVVVTATGTIKTYDELGQTYYYLAVDNFEQA